MGLQETGSKGSLISDTDSDLEGVDKLEENQPAAYGLDRGSHTSPGLPTPEWWQDQIRFEDRRNETLAKARKDQWKFEG